MLSMRNNTGYNDHECNRILFVYEKKDDQVFFIEEKPVYPIIKSIALPVKLLVNKKHYNRRTMKIKRIPKRNIKRRLK